MNFTLGLPNGSMQQPVFDLLARIGLDIRPSGRSGQVAIGGLELFSQAVLMRPQDIPLALLQGKIDSAICGLDCIVETELAEKVAANTKIKRLQELDLSRNTRQSMRVILFGRPDSPPLTQDISISSEYPAITQKHYPNTQISFSHGSTEIKVAMKQFDYGVGVAETGSSLRDNGLQVAEEIMVSPTMFVANKCLPEFIALGDLIAGALEAESHQLIKMNIDPQQKEDVLEVLPALRAPTIGILADQSCAVETIVPKKQTTDLLIRLRTLGATDIVVQNVNAIVG